ncbi:hypothetical protein [Paraburkholderia tropica]|uniref:hypothetical protein n=1 Tax=Paraburkholderia tropica TaxID=92647 RepID=UPI002AB6E25F|nr:hypothetical protein [Paraburkholderia tropica]
MNLTMTNLERHYIHVRSGSSDADFEAEVLRPIAAQDDPTIDDLAEIIGQFISQEDQTLAAKALVGSKLSALIVSTTFCYRAVQADRCGDRELAWNCLAEASFWCGATLSEKDLDEAYQEAIKKGEGAFSKRGQNKQKANADILAEYAYKLVRERMPADRWRTIGDAVLAIKGDVCAFAKKNSLRMAESNAERRLRELLGKMPDVGQLFRSQG